MSSELFSLKGRIAVVVGGAGGLGAAVCKGLAGCGASVAVVDLAVDQTGKLVSDIEAGGCAVMACAADAMSEESLSAACEAVLDRFGKIDILVNAVGGNRPDATVPETGSFFDVSSEALKSVVEFNLFAGTILPAKVFGKAISANPDGGSIVNISSVVGIRPFSRIAGYAAAKAAVINFTQWLAVTLAKGDNPNVRVNTIAPGVVLTEQNRYLLTTPEGGMTSRGKAVIDATPMGRMGEPSDLVGTVIWLASDASKFITGVVIPVDGGFCAFSGV